MNPRWRCRIPFIQEVSKSLLRRSVSRIATGQAKRHLLLGRAVDHPNFDEGYSAKGKLWRITLKRQKQFPTSRFRKAGPSVVAAQQSIWLGTL